MAVNPFGDDNTSSAKRNYLALISVTKDNASLVQVLLKNIQKNIDEKASPLWIDSKGVGVFLSTELTAHDVWSLAISKDRPDDLHELKDILILEIGSDWAARKEAKTANWLKNNVGAPAISVMHTKASPRR